MADEIVKTKVNKNCTVRVHIPILTPEEQELRDKRIYEAALRFAKVIERARMEETGEKT